MSRSSLNEIDPKDPTAILDYWWDWSYYLEEDEVLVEVTWVVPAGLEKTDENIQATEACIWLSGGTAPRDYDVTCRVVTSRGRHESYSAKIKVRDR